jgi:hypothetical protein
MIRSRFVRSFALVLATLVSFSCSDYSTAPKAAPTVAQDGLLGDVVGGLVGTVGNLLKVVEGVIDPNGIEVRAVQWAPSHVNQVRSVSATIGYNGGTLSIPGSDFTITFPRGALSKSTAITIVSDASGYVSYDMKPHGITFAKPVIVTQRLRNTAVYGTSKAWNTFGAYFPQDLLDLRGILKALEIVPTIIFAPPYSETPEIQTWQLKHFSRYMLASG